MSTDIDPNGLTGIRWDFHGVDNNSFCLSRDGGQPTTYEVIEDEDDGYRSSMETVCATPGIHGVFSSMPIATVLLSADPEKSDDWESNETWSLRDDDGHVWLTFGTKNTNDYYPCFVFNYQPKMP